MRSDGRSGRGSGSTSSAPAPSDSIQRRNSFEKGSIGWSSTSLTLSLIWGSKCEARRLGEASSEPVATALGRSPAATLRAAYFNARHAGAADPGGADDLARRCPELGMDHARVARDDLVGAGAAAGEAGDVLWGDAGVPAEVADRLRGELRIGVGDLAGRRVDGVVPGLDAVVDEHAALHRGGLRLDVAEHRLDMGIVDGGIGKGNAPAGDEGITRHDAPSCSSQACALPDRSGSRDLLTPGTGQLFAAGHR